MAVQTEPTWISCRDRLPPDNQVVLTKIDDRLGVRNEQELLRHRNLWWLKDKSMYVYYSPTHWADRVRELERRRA